MVQVEHHRGEFFQAPLPTRKMEGRDWSGLFHFFTRDAFFSYAIATALLADDAPRLKRYFKWGARPDTRLVLGSSPLETIVYACVYFGRERCLKAALEAGANPSLVSGNRRETPLCLAAQLGDRSACELLVAHGAQWNEMGLAEDQRWFSALRFALDKFDDISWILPADRLQHSQRMADTLDKGLALPTGSRSVARF